MDTPTLLYFLKLGALMVNENCEGITHEESLIQPSAGGHCLNWVMGHIVNTRNEVLSLVFFSTRPTIVGKWASSGEFLENLASSRVLPGNNDLARRPTVWDLVGVTICLVGFCFCRIKNES